MEVSRSRFYAYLHRLERPDDPDLLASKARIEAIFKEHRGKYGSRRIVKQLEADSHSIGRYKVRRLMRELGLKAKAPKRFKITTDSRHTFPVAPNLLNRKFDVDEPNRFWATDITYIWSLEGWLYLAVVLDLYSRQVVGWAINKRMKKQLTLDALAMAYWRRKPAPGLLHHSDRGSQYACHDYRKRLDQYGMVASMSRKGNCWDNAPTERFFRSLKSERLSDYRFVTRQSAEMQVLDYISYYNSIRLHSTLGYKTPFAYEKELCRKAA
jgi:transposase InsO family protein